MLALQEVANLSVFGKPVWNSRMANDWLDSYGPKLEKCSVIWTCGETRGYIGTNLSLLTHYHIKLDYNELVTVIRFSPLHYRIKKFLKK